MPVCRVALICPSQLAYLCLTWSIVVTFISHAAATTISDVVDFKSRNDLEVPDSVFGYSSPGQISVVISGELNTNDGIRFFLCKVSYYYIRNFSYQRRQQRVGTNLKKICQYDNLCDTDLSSNSVKELDVNDVSKLTTSRLTLETFSLPDMYIFILANCSPVEGEFTVSLNMTNPGSYYEHLGFEEALFPILAATVIAMLSPVVILLFIGVVTVRFSLHRSVPFALVTVLVAAVLKNIFAILTFVYFFHVGTTGERPTWYLYTRMFIASVSDVAFVVAIIAIASGTCVFPREWFVDDHSPSMFVYIVVTLQLVIFISVKTMFPYNILGAATYFILGLSIGLIIMFMSVRNIRFLGRYGRLITRAHIDIKTTPIGRLQSFYYGTGVLAPIIYVAKFVFLTAFDYSMSRPDLMWGTLEMCDATLIIWMTVFVFPMRRSPLYVNMSNLSNERLAQSETWRSVRRTSTASGESAALSGESGMRAVRGGSTAATGAPSVDMVGIPSTGAASIDGNTAVSADATSVDVGSDTRPSWVAWTSGMPLPRPDITTWGGNLRNGHNRRPRARTVLPTTIVLGMPTEDENAVVLRVGWPTSGPQARPANVVNEVSSVQLSGEAERERRHVIDENSEDNVRRLGHSSLSRCIRMPAWRRSRAVSDNTASVPNSGHGDNSMQMDVAQVTTNDTNSNGRNLMERLRAANLVRSSSLYSTASTTDGVVTTGNNT